MAIDFNEVIFPTVSVFLCAYSNDSAWYRCLELPLGVFDLILDYLPLPRVWHWSLWCLKRRCRLAPLIAVADSYVIIDEILTDANIFKSNDQKGLLVRISRDQEVNFICEILLIHVYDI